MLLENLKSVKICGRDIKIEKIKNYRTIGGLMATYHPAQSVIKIDSDLVGIEYLETLAHEMLHATLNLTGVGFLLTTDIEEALVRAIENNFLKPYTQLLYLDTKKEG